MTDDQLKARVARGVGWSTVQAWGTKLISFLVYPILARLLGPESYGLIALAGVYIEFLNIFSDVSFGAAIEQRKDLRPEHLDSIFWAFIVLGVALTAGSILAAPLSAKFFHAPALPPVICWLSLGFLLQMTRGVQVSLLRRDLRIKALATCDMVSVLVGSCVGIGLALGGFGVWSLVAQRLTNRLINVGLIWWISTWRPRLRFSRVHLQEIAGFGLWVMGARVLHYLNRSFDQLLIGRYLGTVQLGLYYNASRLQTLATGLLIGSYSQVSMPAFSRLQDDLPRFRAAFTKTCRFICLVALPAFMGMAVMAPDLIPVVLGDQWIGSVPVLQILSLVGLVHAIQYVNGAAMMALGRADLRLALQSIHTVANVIGFFIAVKHGIVAVAAAFAIVAYLLAPLETLVNRRLGGVALAPLLRAVMAQAVASLIMGGAVWYCRTRLLMDLEALPRLLICSAIGAVIYGTVALVLDRRLWTDSLDLIRHLRRKDDG